MQKRIELIIIFTLIILIIFSIGFISAASCDVRLRTNCQTDPWDNIVMGISAATNAHGQLNGQTPTYDYVLCCDFGTGDTSCSTDPHPIYGSGVPKNKIIGLSAPTNAHAQRVEETSYPVNSRVCYDSLECISICPDSNYPINMLSLSSSTNAHLGAFADYTTKICCKSTSPFISPNCDLNSASWEFPEAMEGTQVDMILQGTNCAGAAIEFNIYEDNTALPDTLITTTPINGNYDRKTWTTQWMDGNSVLPGDQDPTYYFTAKAIVSDDIFSSLDSTTGNKILTVTEPYIDCNTINLCSDYPDAVVCGSDKILCDVAQRNENCVQGATCSCVWDPDAPDGSKCKFASTLSPAPVTCENGYTLCNTEPLLGTGLDYCYPGSECPTDETPLSDGDSVCDVGEGCSSIDCKDGDTDSCVQGATCLSGKCNIAGQTPEDVAGCEHGYTLCSREDLGLNYCYPGDTCPTGEEILEDEDTTCDEGDGCSSSDCMPGGDINYKDTCLLDAYCKLGSCFSPTYAAGTCIYSETTNDDCSDGMLEYSWTVTWEGTGTKPESCQDGNRVVPCPAQAQLAFFGVYQFIISFAIIVIIYLFFILKKKKKK